MVFFRYVLIFTIIFPICSFSNDTDKGYRLPLDIISGKFLLMNKELSVKRLSNHISNTNYKIPTEEAIEIAEKILRVSSCFQLDPWILASLIEQESSFDKDAISRTGAVGLTQFTPIGIMEANDQLGYHGRVGAPDITSIYFSTAIRNCINPSWIDLWNRIEVKEDSAEFYDLLKLEIKKDITTSITYGGILLKTYLSHVKNKSSQMPAPLKTSEIYFQALVMYNGEPGEAKINYAKAIFLHLDEFYPKDLNFSTR